MSESRTKSDLKPKWFKFYFNTFVTDKVVKELDHEQLGVYLAILLYQAANRTVPKDHLKICRLVLDRKLMEKYGDKELEHFGTKIWPAMSSAFIDDSSEPGFMYNVVMRNAVESATGAYAEGWDKRKAGEAELDAAPPLFDFAALIKGMPNWEYNKATYTKDMRWCKQNIETQEQYDKALAAVKRKFKAVRNNPDFLKLTHKQQQTQLRTYTTKFRTLMEDTPLGEFNTEYAGSPKAVKETPIIVEDKIPQRSEENAPWIPKLPASAGPTVREVAEREMTKQWPPTRRQAWLNGEDV